MMKLGIECHLGVIYRAEELGFTFKKEIRLLNVKIQISRKNGQTGLTCATLLILKRLYLLTKLE